MPKGYLDGELLLGFAGDFIGTMEPNSNPAWTGS